MSILKTKRHIFFLCFILIISLIFCTTMEFHAQAAKKNTTPSSSSFTSSTVAVSKTGTVSADALNVRTSYSTKAKIIGTLYKGDTVYILSSYNGWYNIIYGSGTGWVSSSYITNIQTVSSSTTGSSSQPASSSSVTTSSNTSSTSTSSSSTTSSNTSSNTSSYTSSEASYSSSASSSASSSSSPTSSNPTPVVPTSKLPSKIVAGYYTGWSAYSGYTPDKINASKVNVIHYAFAGLGTNLEIAVGDSYIDYSNFTKLKTLKANNPHLITLIAIGGWNNSNRFSDMALSDTTRRAFAKSCAQFIKQYGFDGVDIDWEYPVSGGGFGRPEDKTNFTLLMKTIREELTAQSMLDGKYYYLTFAGGASTWYINNIQLSTVSTYIDYAVDMTYDLHGPWDTYSDFNAPLYTPTENSPQYKISVDSSIKAWLSAGIPKNKLVLGIPFYGYVYSGVSSNNNGLYQTFSSAKAYGYDSIVANYLSNSTYTKLYSATAQVPYLYGNNTFVSYDDAASIAKKATYAAAMGLRGVGAWELSYDKSSVLLSSAYNNLY